MFTRIKGLDSVGLDSNNECYVVRRCGCQFNLDTEDSTFEFNPCDVHARAVVPAKEVNLVREKLIPLLNHLQIQLPMLTDTEASLVTDLRQLLKEEL